MSRRYVTTPVALFTAMRAVRARGYSKADLRADASAGIVLGLVALPLSMALAIAAGAPPANGLFTAIVAGIIIALSGGSMHSVSGPTAAFVVLLSPVTAKYGLAGLLVATVMAGGIMLAMGLFRLGRLIQFIPHPVTTGFTAGIAVVIAVTQLGDFFGLERISADRVWDRVVDLAGLLPTFHWQDLLVGVFTLILLTQVPRIVTRVPAPLIALAAATGLGLLLGAVGSPVATVTSEFGGIPAVPPLPSLPWQGAELGWPDVVDLAPTALAIALLGAIESLLCAVVADGMTGGRHDPDAELIGLGFGNLIAPFFGGFAATGAIARTATGIRAGGRTPIAVVIHSLFVLVAMLVLAPVLGYLPMAAMAGLLLLVAWNMAEVPHFLRITRIAPRSDVLVMLVCFVLTVTFDMVVSVLVGVVLAALLFMRRMVEISGATLVGAEDHRGGLALPPGVVLYDVAGPLFFGATDKALDALTTVDKDVHTVVIDLDDVPAIDATALVALESAVEQLARAGITVFLSGARPQPRRALVKAGFEDRVAAISTDTDVTLSELIRRAE